MKKTVRINEAKLRSIVAESVRRVLKEGAEPMTEEMFEEKLQKSFQADVLEILNKVVGDVCSDEEYQGCEGAGYDYAEEHARIIADSWTASAIKLLNSKDWHYPAANFRSLDYVMSSEYGVHNFQELLSKPDPVGIFMDWFWDCHGTFGTKYNFRNALIEYLNDANDDLKESQLHKIVSESVKKVLKEGWRTK